jgi:hypothetical protein
MARRIFVSFAYEDAGQARGFNLLPWNRNVDFDFVERHLINPADSENPDYIKSRIRSEMNGTSATVVLIGPTTATSEWVDFEIRESIARGNAVIGIRLKGAENAPVPPALIQAGAKILDWNPHTFSDEIERAILVAGRPPLGPPTASVSNRTPCGR